MVRKSAVFVASFRRLEVSVKDSLVEDEELKVNSLDTLRFIETVRGH